MKQVCLRCKGDMGARGAAGAAEFPVTKGICDGCATTVLSSRGKLFREFLDGLGVPVLLVDTDVRICTGNKHACKILGKSLLQIEGRYGGEAIECIHAKEPDGCGKTLHCKTCTIRRTVGETYATGKSLIRVPAYPDIQTASGAKTLRFLISTEKAGDLVLLEIEDVEEVAGESLKRARSKTAC